MLEFRDIDFGDISKSESERYKNDSRRWGKFWSTSPVDEDGLALPSSGDLAPLCPFSASKLQGERKFEQIRFRVVLVLTTRWRFFKVLVLQKSFKKNFFYKFFKFLTENITRNSGTALERSF